MSKLSEKTVVDVQLGGDTSNITDDEMAAIRFVGQQLNEHYPDTKSFTRSLMESIRIQMCVIRGLHDDTEMEKINKNLSELAQSTHVIEVFEKEAPEAETTSIH